MSEYSITNELIFMRDDGGEKGGLEQTAFDDPLAVAYIKAECVTSASIRERRNLYSPGGEENIEMSGHCYSCASNTVDEDEYPCCCCMHSA
jgi:hypothetical protein